MSTLFNPMAMTGMHPARRQKKNAVNYCFKSSCEINETLITLCWLKRSLTTFNRLFNHTQLELCVRSFLPLLNTEACTSHANKPLLAEMVEQMKTLVKIRYPLNVIRAYDHQKHSWPSRIMYCSFASHIFIITAYCIPIFLWQSWGILVFPHPSSEDYAVRVFFLHSILNGVYSERKQDFTLTVSLYFYWSYHIYIFNYFFFLPHIFWVCWHWC